MQQDLVVAKKLGDIAGECRAHGNLGSAFFSKGNYKDALTSNRLMVYKQCFDLMKQLRNELQDARDTGNVGAVYLAMGDLDTAV